VEQLPWFVDTPPIRRWAQALEREGKTDEVNRRVAAWSAMVEEYGVVTTAVEDRIGILELAYPRKANAMVPPMYRMFVERLRELEENSDVWVILIRAVGKHFSSGGYVGDDGFYAGLDAGEDGLHPEPMRQTFKQMFQPMQRALFECDKPTIAAINGLVAAEAVDIALAADLRTASPESEIWFSFGYTGNTAYTGSAWLLPRMVGLSKAMELLLTAKRISGEEAHSLGIVNRLFSAETLQAESLELANTIASLPPITLRLIKKEVHRCLELASLNGALDMMSMIEPMVQATEDHMDAERAVIEKRDPVVRGY
jgi:2-(1,2-epoxy-1,2-dihydrophenyl)acetyl-CoA isomerase